MSKIKSKIFASPENPPQFCNQDYIHSELLEENLRVLAEKNEEYLSKAISDDGEFSEGLAAELVFSIVKRLSLPIEVKYVAVEIFDKFMYKHITELYEVVETSSGREKKLEWEGVDGVEARIKDQLPLRAASCVQLASKLVSHYDALSPSKTKRYLSSNNLPYSLKSVVNSERRVLNTLDFRLNCNSPLTYVELILEILGRNCPGLETDQIYEVCIKLLDIAYVEKILLCERLCETADLEFDLKRTSDYFIIAVCVVAAAGFIIDAESSDALIEQISLITCVDEAEIIMIATVLVNIALEPFEK